MMAGTLRIAAIQMDAAPAPVADRLARAATLISDAAAAGAQLAVLPEVFNTGYAYTDANYALAEPITGQTATWMKAQAAQHQVYVAGTLLLLDGSDIYNSLLLIAPDGQMWRYDKHYPWAWERAYFRDGDGVTVADTPLGKLGLMICWDYAHTSLWEQYAGRVDAMVIASCPPAITQSEALLPSRRTAPGNASMPLYHGDDMPFGAELNALGAWMGVPLVNTSGSGTFDTTIPAALFAGGMLANQPDALRDFLSAPEQTRLRSGYYPQTKIVAADGTTLRRITEQGDQIIVETVELPDTPPRPTVPPPSPAFTLLSYFLSDGYLPAVTIPVYRRNLRRVYGAHMAPVDPRTRIWMGVTVAAFVLGWLARGNSAKQR
ncbi:MAG: carbon-nitrogen hydrolase family protein [Anaerolineae bacterium]